MIYRILPLATALQLLPLSVASSASRIDVASLNSRIELSIVEGRTWSHTPGGIAGILFDIDSAIFPAEYEVYNVLGATRKATSIVFLDNNELDSQEEQWLKVKIVQIQEGPWKVDSIIPCSASQVEEAIEKIEKRRNFVLSPGFDFYTQSPLELIQFLAEREHPKWHAPLIWPGWIKESDIPALMELIYSKEPCAHIESMVSPSTGNEWSTVGNLAAFLIDSFRHDSGLPRFGSRKFTWDINEIQEWWEGWRESK